MDNMEFTDLHNENLNISLYYTSTEETNKINWSLRSKTHMTLHLIMEYNNRMDLYGSASPLPHNLTNLSKNKLELLCKHYYYTNP